MLPTSTRKMAALLISTVAMLAITFFSCQKELTGDGITTDPPNLTTKISSSVSGFVTVKTGLALTGAVVTFGNSSSITDKYGFFEIGDVEVVKEAAVVTVTMPGYFKGIKTFLATEGKSAFFRIKLISKTTAGNVDAALGGSVTLTNGLTVSLPANAIVNAVTNAIYVGQVNVSATWMDPTSPELNMVMPGDLRGTDTAGALKILTTYGMAAVELTGIRGELLQIAPGKKATLTIPLPASLSASAPATIPLWYFDETNGLWKQQGMAVKTGNSYTGEVSHFSFWNCDVPSNYVRFNCTITNAKGIPVQNALVKVSVVNNPQNAGFGYSDSSGYTGGAVPANASLLLEVFSEYNCLTGLYAKNFTTTNSNVSLGKIVIPVANSATITGNVNDCANAPVTNGYVLMYKNGLNYFKPLSKTGVFNFTTTLCAGSSNATFIAEDKTALKASDPIAVSLNSGPNDLGTLIACKISTQQFINYTINGVSYSLTSPVDSIAHYSKPQNTPPTVIINGFSLSNNNMFGSASIYFVHSGIGLNSSQNLLSFTWPQVIDSLRILTPINIKITEYGMVGQFIAGNFSGIINGAPPGNIAYNVSCSFRVRRSN